MLHNVKLFIHKAEGMMQTFSIGTTKFDDNKRISLA